jgi:hypothetical protein
MRHDLLLLLSAVTVVLFMGCAPAHPITEAVCVSQCLESWDHERVLVWSNDPRVEPLLADWVQKQEVLANRASSGCQAVPLTHWTDGTPRVFPSGSNITMA